MRLWFTFWKLIFKSSITGKKHSFPMFDPTILMKFAWTCWIFLLFPLWNLSNSAALLTFLVLNLNGTKTLMGFIRQQAGFCRTQKLKLPSLVISRRVRFACVENTSSSDVLGRPTWEAWAPQLECLGARSAPWNFYSGDQLWGLGTLTKMLGSPKGSLKFSLEHSLDVYV